MPLVDRWLPSVTRYRAGLILSAVLTDEAWPQNRAPWATRVPCCSPPVASPLLISWLVGNYEPRPARPGMSSPR